MHNAGRRGQRSQGWPGGRIACFGDETSACLHCSHVRLGRPGVLAHHEAMTPRGHGKSLPPRRPKQLTRLGPASSPGGRAASSLLHLVLSSAHTSRSSCGTRFPPGLRCSITLSGVALQPAILLTVVRVVVRGEGGGGCLFVAESLRSLLTIPHCITLLAHIEVLVC